MSRAGRRIESARWYRLAAKQGEAKAQYSLGVMYHDGKGVSQDYQEAIRWYRMAANQGYADAQYNLGVMYRKGLGVPKDYVQAHMWYNLAALQQTGTDRKKSVKRRNDLEKKMQDFDVRKAQRLAREWKPKRSGSQ